MKNFIVYNGNGDILRCGCCPNSTFDLQAGDGEYVIEGIADDENQKIVNGQIVDKVKTDSELNENALIELRQRRDGMLMATDWTQLPDAPLTTAQKAKYKAYRTALRDLPQKYVNMQNITNVDYPQLEDF